MLTKPCGGGVTKINFLSLLNNLENIAHMHKTRLLLILVAVWLSWFLCLDLENGERSKGEDIIAPLEETDSPCVTRMMQGVVAITMLMRSWVTLKSSWCLREVTDPCYALLAKTTLGNSLPLKRKALWLFKWSTPRHLRNSFIHSANIYWRRCASIEDPESSAL